MEDLNSRILMVQFMAYPGSTLLLIRRRKRPIHGGWDNLLVSKIGLEKLPMEI